MFSASTSSQPLPLFQRGPRLGIAVTLPKPMASGAEAKGRFGKQDFVYLSDAEVHRCPAGTKLKYHCTQEEDGQMRGALACSSAAARPACNAASHVGSMSRIGGGAEASTRGNAQNTRAGLLGGTMETLASWSNLRPRRDKDPQLGRRRPSAGGRQRVEARRASVDAAPAWS
jgi:hypothetical protein